ncbi:MAG: divergent polysaccharide deacetylase family protein [Candidatus Cloacimonadaceae bacterium]|nr:divergent polysaccharide deacetylase family protein [Candidatus Cloacimonadaceae bacterium]MDP3113648.1 divergent polysaccharide deacetylase family protein [Candidatus Cloacimonadaceae bacterium]
METNRLKISVIGAAVLIAALMVSFGCRKESVQKQDMETGESSAASVVNDSIPVYSEESDHVEANGIEKYISTKYDSVNLASYKYTWTDSKDIPPVVIIVDDFGYAGGDLLKGFAELPPQVVFAVLPDLRMTKKSAEIAIQYGHEVIIHIPMEAKAAKIKPGERYLKTTDSQESITKMLDDFHLQLPMAIAANNHMGSSATDNKYLMSVVLNHLNSKNLYFIDSATTSNTIAYKLARTLGYRGIKRDLFLDVPDNSDTTIAARISQLGSFKGRKEPVIILTHCHNFSKLNALKKFIDQITAKGVRIISLAEAFQPPSIAGNR